MCLAFALCHVAFEPLSLHSSEMKFVFCLTILVQKLFHCTLKPTWEWEIGGRWWLKWLKWLKFFLIFARDSDVILPTWNVRASAISVCSSKMNVCVCVYSLWCALMVRNRIHCDYRCSIVVQKGEGKIINYSPQMARLHFFNNSSRIFLFLVVQLSCIIFSSSCSHSEWNAANYLCELILEGLISKVD